MTGLLIMSTLDFIFRFWRGSPTLKSDVLLLHACLEQRGRGCAPNKVGLPKLAVRSIPLLLIDGLVPMQGPRRCVCRNCALGVESAYPCPIRLEVETSRAINFPAEELGICALGARHAKTRQLTPIWPNHFCHDKVVWAARDTIPTDIHQLRRRFGIEQILEQCEKGVKIAWRLPKDAGTERFWEGDRQHFDCLPNDS